jgi:hypothetical protein
MRAFIVGCLIAVILAVAGYYYLSSIQIPVSEAFSSDAVRLNWRPQGNDQSPAYNDGAFYWRSR